MAKANSHERRRPLRLLRLSKQRCSKMWSYWIADLPASGKSSIQTELSCSASLTGAPAIIPHWSPDHGTPGNRLLLFFRVLTGTGIKIWGAL